MRLEVLRRRYWRVWWVLDSEGVPTRWWVGIAESDSAGRLVWLRMNEFGIDA